MQQMLCSIKILQFLTGVAGILTQVVLYNGRKMVAVVYALDYVSLCVFLLYTLMFMFAVTSSKLKSSVGVA